MKRNSVQVLPRAGHSFAEIEALTETLERTARRIVAEPEVESVEGVSRDTNLSSLMVWL